MALKTGLLLNRSRQVPAEDTPAFGGIAERFRRAGDLDRAITLCREGLRKFPTLLSARVTLGWALLDKGEYDEARRELEQVLRRAPDNLAAIRGLAELHDRTDHLRSSHHDDEQDIDLATLTATIEEEERVAAAASAGTDIAARQSFAELALEQPVAASFEALDDFAILQGAAAGSEISLTEFEVAPSVVFDQSTEVAAAHSKPAEFEVADVVLTSPRDFAAEASAASVDFYAAEPVVLSLASEPTAPETAPLTMSLQPTPVAFTLDEPVASDGFDLVSESQGLDPAIEANEPVTLSLGPLDREGALLPFEVAPVAFSEQTPFATTAADTTTDATEEDLGLVTLPGAGELEFDDLSLAVGALGLEAASLEPMVTDTLLDDPWAASAQIEIESSRSAFDDVAPVQVAGTLAPPDMAGVFDHDFGLAAERAEASHDYDLPDGHTGWAPEHDVRLAAFSSMADGFNENRDGFDGYHNPSSAATRDVTFAGNDGNVLAMAARTPIPRFSTAGLERLLRQVQARRVALATSSVA